MAVLSSVATNDSAAATRRLVEQTEGIAGNTQSIDAVADETERLRQCIEASEKSNFMIIGRLATLKREARSLEHEKLSLEQVEEMLKKLDTSIPTDGPKINLDHKYLEQICQNKLVYNELALKIKNLRIQCQFVLDKFDSVSTIIIEKSIQALTTLRVETVQAGLQPTSHDNSAFL